MWYGVLHPGYIALDTPWLVCNNPILSTGSYNHIWAIFTDLSLGTRQTLGAEYLPFRDLSVLLDFMIFGSNLIGHHLHSLFLYFASCSLLLSISIEIFGRKNKVWLLVFLYMVLPIHVESVAWLASRKDILALFFGLLSIWCYLRTTRPMLWATVFCVCAYWSKNTAIVIPVILVFVSVLYRNGNPKNPQWWLQWLPLGVIQLLMLILTMAVGADMKMFSEPRAADALSVLSITAQVWLHYLNSVVFPLSLSAYYVEPQAGWNLQAILGLMLMLLTLSAPFWRRIPAVAMGFAWIFFGLLPVSQLIPIQNLVADRYLLFPSIAVIFLGHAVLKNRRGTIVLMVWISISAYQTWLRTPVFHDSISFWQDLTIKQPTLVRGWASLAGQYTERGHYDTAESILREGQQKVASTKEKAQIHQGLGLIAYKRGELDTAEIMLQLAIHEDDSLYKASNNLMKVYQRQGKHEQAYTLGKQLCRDFPLYDVGCNTLGVLELERKNFSAARVAFQQALAVDPYNVSALANMGNVAFLEKDYDQAQQWWERVLQLDPELQHAQAGLNEIKRLRNQP